MKSSTNKTKAVVILIFILLIVLGAWFGKQKIFLTGLDLCNETFIKIGVVLSANINYTPDQRNSLPSLCVTSNDCFSSKIQKYLIENGAFPNQRGYYNQVTPLMIAAYNLNIEKCVTLLEYDANPNLVDDHGRSAAFYVFRLSPKKPNKQIEILQLLQRYNGNIFVKDLDSNSLFHKAMEANDLTVASWLSDKGLNINARNRRGETPLILAGANKCDREMFEFLFESGADFSIQDYEGNSVLDRYMSSLQEYEDQEVIDFLTSKIK